MPKGKPTGKDLSGSPFFLMRQRRANIILDASGYWSYPAIINTKTRQQYWLSLVLPTVPMLEKKRTALFRPKALVLTKAKSTVLVRYENFRLGHDPFPSLSWNKPVAMFPHKGIWNLTYANLRTKEMELLRAYEKAGNQFSKQGTLPKTFTKQFLDLIHPIFLPYLKHLSPRFFTALGVEQK